MINRNSSKFKSWISAARLRTIPLSVSGVLIGSFESSTSNNFNFLIFFLAIATTISYQVLSNFANDYGDGIKGTDINRVGPKRAIQSGSISIKEMKNGILTTSVISFFLTVLLVFESFKNSIISVILFLILGILSIIAAIKYTVGNSPYGYLGLGDLFVFIFFGIISVLGSNFLFTSSFNASLILPAVTIGLLSVGVLNLNNMRDIQNDTLAGKKTICVRIGLNNSKTYHVLLVLISMISMISYLILQQKFSSFIIILILINIIWLISDLKKVSRITEPKKFDLFLKPLVFATVFYSLILSLNFAFLDYI